MTDFNAARNLMMDAITREYMDKSLQFHECNKCLAFHQDGQECIFICPCQPAPRGDTYRIYTSCMRREYEHAGEVATVYVGTCRACNMVHVVIGDSEARHD